MIITITGKPCSGKSTIANILIEKHHFKRIGVGDMFKAEAERRGMSSEEFNAFCIKDPSYDFFIDKETARLGKELENENIIFDSRLAWHFVPKSFKVFVDVTEDEMAKRLALSNRTGKEKITDIKKAKKSLINRFNLENERYRQLYGTDNLNFSNYDLVIDTTNISAEKAAEILWNEYQKFCKKKD